MPNWAAVSNADARAALLMLLHTGVRMGEIGQLRRQDFLIRGGITAIRITAEAGSVKNADSERFVPLADHLLADTWFSTWLAGIMDGTRPDAPALPSANGRKAENPSDVLTKWFKAFRAHVELPAGQLNGSHKFRHWIRSSLADKGVGDATADSITGHAAQGSSGRVVYTAAASLPVMLEALNRLSYPKIFNS
jgi:integrase